MSALKAIALTEPAADQQVFIANLKYLMNKHQINEAKLSRATLIPQATLHKILSGKTADPRISTLHTLANYFNISVDELFGKSASSEIRQTQHTAKSIPLISWGECIKGPNFIQNLTPINWNNWLTTDSQADNLYALTTKPSMEPYFPKNTVLIIDPDASAQDGDLIIVLYPNIDEATIRELSLDGPQKKLLSINSNQEFDTWDKHIILGVVTQSRFFFQKNKKL